MNIRRILDDKDKPKEKPKKDLIFNCKPTDILQPQGSNVIRNDEVRRIILDAGPMELPASNIGDTRLAMSGVHNIDDLRDIDGYQDEEEVNTTASFNIPPDNIMDRDYATHDWKPDININNPYSLKIKKPFKSPVWLTNIKKICKKVFQILFCEEKNDKDRSVKQ